MSNPLVIVESPTKAKTISRFLAGKALVLASQGHIRDLPDHTLGVDIAHQFLPSYELTTNGKRIVPQLKKAAKSADAVYLATDPDREGEAISWHLQEALAGSTKAPFYRISFHEITQNAIQNAFNNAGNVNQNMVNAQQARRVLDRLVGYQVSPLLWKQIQKGTSAGRVQTVALRLVVEREREIQAFKSVEYWNMDGIFATAIPGTPLKARLSKINDCKVLVATGDDAQRLEDALMSKDVAHKVLHVETTPRKKNPAPPFITSTLQQAAGSALHLGASQTMKIAQELYEGIDLGSGQVGLITYMRTDSFNISLDAQTAAKAYILKNFGPDYVPETPNRYRARKLAQEAHEAIRPTDLRYSPDEIAEFLTPQQLKVYRLIWNRFLASQMTPAKQLDHVIEVESKGGALQYIATQGLVSPEKTSSGIGITCIFRAAARETIFPGFLKVYNLKEVGETEDPDEALNTLPALPEGSGCTLNSIQKQQCFTQPPARYSEASLVKALEQNGVGRPSTYATTVNTIQTRSYVEKEKGSLKPTDLGFRTCDFLVQKMPMLFDVGFTAQMETELDTVEEGNLDWIEMLQKFYGKFQEWSGCVASTDNQDVAKILALFPEDFQFAAPVKKGRRTYDDSEFIAKLRAQLEQDKSPTEKQWQALLMTVARYSADHPELLASAEKLGFGDTIRQDMQTLQAAVERPKIQVTPEIQALLKAMAKIEFKEPRKIRNRTYDDGKFFRSLADQAAGGQGLSDAQLSALLKIASNYAAQIPDYATLVTAVTGTSPETAPAEESAASGEEQTKLAPVIALIDGITSWRPVSSKGRFTFDDKKFMTSIKEQFTNKGSLTPRQVAAFVKTLQNYAEQLPNLKQVLETANLSLQEEKRKEPELLDEECPLCHSKLIRRWTRGRSFVGCSAFPKCRYIQK